MWTRRSQAGEARALELVLSCDGKGDEQREEGYLKPGFPVETVSFPALDACQTLSWTLLKIDRSMS